jgi:hypothetical protein
MWLACRFGRGLARFPWPAFRTDSVLYCKPRFFTVCRTHSSAPYGYPLSMLTRTRSISFAVNGALTRAVQFAARCTGQGDNKALIASVPLALDRRLPHCRSCARSTNPADKGFPST